MMRIKQNTQIQSGIHYKQVREHLQEMEEKRPAEPISPTGQRKSVLKNACKIFGSKSLCKALLNLLLGWLYMN